MNKPSRLDKKIKEPIATYIKCTSTLLISALSIPIVMNIFTAGEQFDSLSTAGVIFTLLSAIIFVAIAVKKEHPIVFNHKNAKSTIIIVCTILFVLFAYSTINGLLNIYSDIKGGKLSTINSLIIGADVSICVGLLLFVFRIKFRGLYGFSEMMVGVFIVGHKIYSANLLADGALAFYLAVLTAGLYLIVRGMDNIHQWYEGRKPIES